MLPRWYNFLRQEENYKDMFLYNLSNSFKNKHKPMLERAASWGTDSCATWYILAYENLNHLSCTKQGIWFYIISLTILPSTSVGQGALFNFLKDLFLLERDLQRGGRKIFYLLATPPSGHYSQNWINRKPGTWNFFQVSPQENGPKALGNPLLLS